MYENVNGYARTLLYYLYFIYAIMDINMKLKAMKIGMFRKLS